MPRHDADHFAGVFTESELVEMLEGAYIAGACCAINGGDAITMATEYAGRKVDGRCWLEIERGESPQG